MRVRLDNLTERILRKNKNNISSLPLTISAQYGLVDQITFFNKIIASKDMSNYYLLKKGEFAYNKSYSSDYPWGAIKRLDNHEQGALSSLYICFAPQNNVSSDFLLQYFESPKWHKEVAEIAVEGVRNHGLLNISVQDFFKTHHYIPYTKQEQNKIARFLSLLDERIATQNKIIEELESLIKGISRKLLDEEEGHYVSLENILKERIEKTTINNQYEVLSSTVNGIFIQREYFSREIASLNNVGYKVLRLNEIVLSPQNLWMGNINYNKSFKIGIVSPSYKIFSIADCYDKDFIAALLKTNRALYNYALASEQGASIVRRNLNIEAFKQIVFKLPSYKKQCQIGKTISLFEKSLENNMKLKNSYELQKTYLLRHMFI